MYPVHVRGSSIGARTEYGALRFLLDATEDEEPKHPIFVFQDLAKLLHDRAQGRTVVLLVDNAHLLDELAALVIGLLVRSGQARAVIAGTGIAALSADLVNLWKDGLLDFQDIEPFSPAETEAWVATALDANISRLAVRALWDTSAGNPLILKTLVAEQVRAGSLVNKDGTYVLAAAVVLGGKPLSDIVAARLNRLTEAERNVLELLALSGGLTAENLRGIATSGDLATLMERRLAHRASGGATIRIKNPVVAEIVRREVPPGRSKHLRKLLGSSLDLSADPAVPLKAYAAWNLTSGSVLEPGLALGATEEANRTGDGDSALRFLAHFADKRVNHRAVIGEACALLQLNRQAEAEEVLEAFSNNHLDQLPLASIAEFLLMRASLACTQKDAPSEAEGYLEQLRTRLGAIECPPAAPDILGILTDQLILAEATVTSYQGRYAPSISALTTLYVNGRGASEELRLRAGALLSEALAMIGRQDDAVRVAEEVIERMEVSGLTERLHHELRQRFMIVYLTAGLWNRCAEVLSYAPRPEATPGLGLRGLDVLGAGLMQAYEGRAERALEALVPAIVQLRFLRSEGALGVALAAAAYAHALRGSLQESGDCLRELKALPPRKAWTFKGPSEYFTALAEAFAAPGPEAIAELLHHADGEQRAGRISHELFFLSAVVQLGELTAAPRLLAVARRCQGVFAEACSLMATGLMAENPELLLTAGELARGFGNERFCRDAALAAHDVATRTTNRTAARRALHMAAESERKMNGRSQHNAAIARLDCLTSRERDVVQRVAAGASNRDIAQELHISVRTVEGHLYQSYTKLQITGRDLLHQVHQDAVRAGAEG
jgi:DNA-binding CsgD family transcriptional regulator